MKQTRFNQRGQSVTEALLMLPLLAVLLWAVSGIGTLQFSAQRTTQTSRQAVMAAALGQPVGSLRAPAGTDLSAAAEALSGIGMPRAAALQDEWFGGAMKMLSVEARTRPLPADSTFGLLIARQLSVASGAGYAYDDADAQRRVASSRTGWLQASQSSTAVAGRMQRYVDGTDAPWGRPKLSLDWLSAWADVVPADRLGKRGEKSR